MKKTLILLISLLFLPCSLLALIEDSQAECDKRYGSPLLVKPYKGVETIRKYRIDNGFLLSVFFRGDRAVLLIFSKGSKRTEKDVEFEEKYINPNGKGLKWAEVDGNRRRKDHPYAKEWHWLRGDGKVLLRMDEKEGLWIIEDMRYDQLKKDFI